jgi:hypothetical protein
MISGTSTIWLAPSASLIGGWADVWPHEISIR